MKRILITMIIMASLLTAGTAMSMGRDGSGPSVGVVVGIPALPGVVVLESEPYYYHNDYHYHYNNNHWYYSRSRRGPWAELPRDHYPKKIRYKGRSGKHYKHRHERDRKDGYRDRDRYNHRDDDRRDHKRGRDDDRWDDDRRGDDRGRDNQRR